MEILIDIATLLAVKTDKKWYLYEEKDLPTLNNVRLTIRFWTTRINEETHKSFVNYIEKSHIFCNRNTINSQGF